MGNMYFSIVYTIWTNILMLERQQRNIWNKLVGAFVIDAKTKILKTKKSAFKHNY